MVEDGIVAAVKPMLNQLRDGSCKLPGVGAQRADELFFLIWLHLLQDSAKRKYRYDLALEINSCM